MIAQLVLDLIPYVPTVAAAGFTGFVAGRQGRTPTKVITNRPATQKRPESLSDALKDGYKVIEQMKRDIKALYHPDGCECAICEITADDDKKPEPDNTENNTANTTPDPSFVRALIEKVDGLHTQNYDLRRQLHEKSQARVITRVEERKTPFQLMVEELAQQADMLQQPVTYTHEDQGREIQIFITPQRPPDATIVKHGGEVVRQIWHPQKPQSGSGSIGFTRNPNETDREAMQRLAQKCRNHEVEQRLARSYSNGYC